MYGAMQREDLWLLPARVDPSLQAAQSCSAVIKAHRSHPDHKYLFYFLTKAQHVLPIKTQPLQAGRALRGALLGRSCYLEVRDLLQAGGSLAELSIWSRGLQGANPSPTPRCLHRFPSSGWLEPRAAR